MTAAEYDRAVNLLAPSLTGMVIGGSVNANWLPDGRFWYRAETQTGSEFKLVAPSTRRIAPAFDHQRLAIALSTAAGGTFSATALPFEQIDLSARADSVAFNLGQRRFRCDVAGRGCIPAGAATRSGGGRGGR
jgi:hypothetical protein